MTWREVNSQYVTGHGDTEELQLQLRGAAQLGNVGVGTVSRNTSLNVPAKQTWSRCRGSLRYIYINYNSLYIVMFSNTAILFLRVHVKFTYLVTVCTRVAMVVTNKCRNLTELKFQSTASRKEDSMQSSCMCRWCLHMINYRVPLEIKK